MYSKEQVYRDLQMIEFEKNNPRMLEIILKAVMKKYNPAIVQEMADPADFNQCDDCQ